MNKNCSRCSKIVYPIEELKCLDKTWHKTCFRCHECGMTLNMKTYKGFNKLPYCEAHIPKAKATAIADTPELKRIAENTKIQSNVQYHADFEKQKGKLTQVADDPETLRIKQNTKIFSNVTYHGDLEKKAAMEKQREVAEVADNRDIESEYFSETLAAESLSQYQPQNQQQLHHHNHNQSSAIGSLQTQHKPNQAQLSPSYYSSSQKNSQLTQQQLQAHNYPDKYQIQSQQLQSNNHHHNSNSNYQSASVGAVQSYQQQQSIHQQNNIRNSVVQKSVSPSGGGGIPLQQQQLLQQQQQQQLQQQQALQQQQLNNKHQQQQQLQQAYYDQYENYARPTAQTTPVYNNNLNNNQSIVYNNAHHPGGGSGNHHSNSSSVVYNNSAGGGYNNHYNNHTEPTNAGIGKISDYDPLTDGPRNVPNTQRQSSTLIYSSDRGLAASNMPRRIGSVADIDPANGVYGSIEQNNYHAHNPHNQNRLPQQQQQQQLHQPQPAPQKTQKSLATKRVFRALYDYEAQDTDEVSFTEGDLIFEVESIDAGWMTGRVERTGQTGMLPANYVDAAMI